MGVGNEIKTQVSKFKSNLGLITGIITVVAGISNHFIGKTRAEINLIIVSAGIYIIARGLFLKIKNSSVTRLGKTEWEYPEEKRKLAGTMLLLNNILTPLFIVSSILVYFIPSKEILLEKKQLGIVVSRFIPQGEDEFSMRLHNLLNDTLAAYDTIGVATSNAHIPYYNKDKLDNLRDTFDQIGFKHGMLVFGAQILRANGEPNYLQCRIYVRNVKNKKIDSYIHNGKPVIKTPELYDFHVDNEVAKVSSFVLGLLFSGLGNIEQSEKQLLNALRLNELKTDLNEGEKKFAAYCNLLLAHNNTIKNDYKTATQFYTTGLGFDSSNAYLHYNLAVSYYVDNDTMRAYGEFIKANKIDTGFHIPIETPKEKIVTKTEEKHIVTTDEKKKNEKKPEKKIELKKKDRVVVKQSPPVETKTVVAEELKPEIKFPQPSSNPPNKPLYVESDMIYQATFDGPPKRVYYFTYTNDMILYTSGGNYQVVGKIDRIRGIITDTQKNIWGIGASGIIYDNKNVRVGTLVKM